MKITPTTTRRAGLALAGLLAITLTAAAKKPVPPPPEPPPAAAYDFVRLGNPDDISVAADVNEDGLVVGATTTPDGSPNGYKYLTLVVPEEEDGTLVWRKDADLDGRNDLLRDLGIPPEVAPELAHSAIPWKINDDGLILVRGRQWSQGTEDAVQSVWILPPRVEDGRLTWADLDSEGLNWQIAPLPVATVQPHLDVTPTSLNNHGELTVVVSFFDGDHPDTMWKRGFLLVPDLYEVSPDGAVTAEYPAADLDGDGLNDHLIDLGIGVSAWEGQLPPLQPAAINDQGDIAGTVKGEGHHDQPFVIRPRQDENGGLIWNEDADGDGVNDLVVYLPLPDGDNDSDIYGMNEDGTIVGWVHGSREGQRAAVWQVDWETGIVTVTRLGTALRNYDASVARAVNAAGQVVGASYKYPRKNTTPLSNERSWLFDQGEMVPVADLVSPETGLAEVESRAFSMNDSGLIVGHTRPVDSSWWSAFIMVPAESP
jgi:uncharacterized membrane protein